MTVSHDSIKPLLNTAVRLIEPVRGLTQTLRDHLTEAGRVETVDPRPPETLLPPACVDGAVAHDQTDALVWVTAVGVAQTRDRPDHTVTASSVAPVSAETDRLRSALMATCELSATTAWDDRLVLIDGGLATPLISVAQGLTVSDPDVATAVDRHYTDTDVATSINTYIDAILAGRVAALPKQDTAAGFLEQWADELAETLHDDQRQALSRLRDRPVITALLQPGEMLRPRRAVELGRTEVKPNDNSTDRARTLDAAYGRLRNCDDVHVTYVKPTHLPSRVIKIEYVETDQTGFTIGRRLAALVDNQTRGPRMREPLMQHQADRAAKRLVSTNLSTITTLAARSLDDPTATSHYRTCHRRRLA